MGNFDEQTWGLSASGITGPAAMTQIGADSDSIARDMALHVNHWFVDKRAQTLKWIKAVGCDDVTTDDLDLVAELLTAAANRSL